jgi:Predicted transcriptional regulators
MKEKVIEDVGRNIAKYRKLNGMTQKYLASRTGLERSTLCRIETQNCIPRADTLAKIINVIGITPNQLYGVDSIDEESVVWGNESN